MFQSLNRAAPRKQIPISNRKPAPLPGKKALSLLVSFAIGLWIARAAAGDFTVLHEFADNPDGSSPQAPLAISGNTLYGSTYGGGSASNGIVFKIETNGTGYAILKAFPEINYSITTNDGAQPMSGVTLGGATLYGTTASGGGNGITRHDL